MKTYTDYGQERYTPLKSCVLVVEDTLEWIVIRRALTDELERIEHILSITKSSEDTSITIFKEQIAFLKKLISQLETKNTIPLENLSSKVINHRDLSDLYYKDSL